MNSINNQSQSIQNIYNQIKEDNTEKLVENCEYIKKTFENISQFNSSDRTLLLKIDEELKNKITSQHIADGPISEASGLVSQIVRSIILQETEELDQKIEDEFQIIEEDVPQLPAMTTLATLQDIHLSLTTPYFPLENRDEIFSSLDLNSPHLTEKEIELALTIRRLLKGKENELKEEEGALNDLFSSQLLEAKEREVNKEMDDELNDFLILGEEAKKSSDCDDTPLEVLNMTHPGLPLAQRIVKDAGAISENHLDALATRHGQIKEILHRFLTDHNSELLSSLGSLIKEVLTNPAKLVEVATQTSNRFPTANFSIAELDELQKINEEFFSEALKGNLNYLQKMLAAPKVGPRILFEVIDNIVPLFFKKPDQEITFQKNVLLGALSGASLFIKDLNACIEKNKLQLKDHEQLFVKMHALYEKEFKEPFSNGNDFEVEALKKGLRKNITDILPILIPSDKSSPHSPLAPVSLILPIIPSFIESFVTRMMTPETLYGILVRVAELYGKGGLSSDDDQLEAQCQDTCFQEAPQRYKPDELFTKALGDTLFDLSVEMLKLPQLTTAAAIVKHLDIVIKPQLLASAKVIEKSLYEMASSVCIYLPFQVLNKFFYDSKNGGQTPSLQGSLLLHNDTRKIDQNALSEEIRQALNLKQNIDNSIDAKYGTLKAKACKAVIPTTKLNKEIPDIIADIISNPQIIYLMTGYILKSIQRQFPSSIVA